MFLEDQYKIARCDSAARLIGSLQLHDATWINEVPLAHCLIVFYQL